MPKSNPSSQSDLQKKLSIPAKLFSFFSSPNGLLVFITIVLLTALGGYEFSMMKKEMKKNLSGQLQAILSANVESLRIWMNDIKRDTEVLASQPEIKEKIISLIAMAQKKDVAANVLKQTSEFKWLRENLGNACKKYGFIGFVILDTTGYQVGALLDNAVGKRKLIERSDFFYRSLQGDTVVSHPFPGEVDLPDSEGVWKPNRPTMFASTPIRNDTGETIGILAFRIRPELDFSHMLEVSRFGKTGESFAFNADGFLLTHSRFFQKIKELQLIPEESDATAILNIQLRNPHKKLNGKGVSHKNRDPFWELTQMAASAIQGKSAVNVDGYIGYRGKQVVGAWTWLPEHRFGVATEIEAKEAFGAIIAISKGFLVIFSFLIAATLAAFIFRLLQKRTVAERNLAQENVREREKAIELLAKFPSENPNPVLRIGQDGNLLYANPPAIVLLNDGAIQVGDQVSIEFQAMVANALTSKSIQEINTKVGTQTFLMQWVPILIEGYVNVYGRDITERKKAEDKLARKAEELERSNQELEDFAFIASHDLQEPLRKVVLFGDRLKSVYPSTEDDRGINYIDRLQKSISKMQNFIHDLLEYSRVNQSSALIKLIDLNEIVSEVVSDLQTQLDHTQGRIEIAPLPAIEGNEFLMAQLFQNLIANALKYSRENVPPQIKISSRPNGDSAWDILVEDNGIGIEPKYFHKIFKPFERLHSSDQYGGNGIGLAICSKVSTKHGGKIRIESQPGKGSTFFLTLPKAQSSDSRAIKETEFVAG